MTNPEYRLSSMIGYACVPVGSSEDGMISLVGVALQAAVANAVSSRGDANSIPTAQMAAKAL